MPKFKQFPKLFLSLIIILSLSLGGAASAFKDVNNDPEKKSIERMVNKGLFKKDKHGNFKPAQKLDQATALALIVNGLNLNLNHMKFAKEPKASDYFTKVKDNAWYSKVFVIAHLNGLDVPKDINPSAKVSREQFSHWLYQAFSKKDDYMWIEIYINIKDEKSIDQPFKDSIQKLLIADIAKLDKKQNFRPNDPITRSEAAGMLDRTLDLIEKNKPVEPNPEPTPEPEYDVTLSSQLINNDVELVTVTATVPHPGYGIEITNIAFNNDQAVITYKINQPDKDKFYPQVITDVQATAYVAAKYQPVLSK